MLLQRADHRLAVDIQVVLVGALRQADQRLVGFALSLDRLNLCIRIPGRVDRAADGPDVRRAPELHFNPYDKLVRINGASFGLHAAAEEIFEKRVHAPVARTVQFGIFIRNGGDGEGARCYRYNRPAEEIGMVHFAADAFRTGGDLVGEQARQGKLLAE